jgi:hypothetical protein
MLSTLNSMDWSHVPKQVDGIEVNPVADGYVLYQADRDRVHYLNPTAVLVLEMCNGRVRAEEIPGLLKDAYDLAEPPTAEVAECLAKLLDEGLVR